MRNFSYYFYVDYFKDLDYSNLQSKDNKKILDNKSNNLLHFKITNNPTKFGNCSFDMQVSSPGLLVGIGYPHEIEEIKGGFKFGLSLDYTTGVPYIPGSSIKGVLKDIFGGEKPNKDKLIKEKKEWIKSIIGEFDFEVLREELFEGEDIFFDAFIIANNEKVFDDDYITPHKQITKEPIPLRFLKIKNAKFRFCFYFKKNKEKKEKLIKEVLKRGVGAKTAFGFGRFQ
jgi:CRISPR-associated protein Cmr6